MNKKKSKSYAADVSVDEIKKILKTYPKTSREYLKASLQALVLVEVYNMGREPSEKLEITWSKGDE